MMGVIALGVMLDRAVKEFVEAGGLEVAVQRRRQPEGQQSEGEEATQTVHARTEREAGRVVNVGPRHRVRWTAGESSETVRASLGRASV